MGFVATCASAYYYAGISPYTYRSYYDAYNPIWRKKRAAPEAPAGDQKADEAYLYNYYAHPYSSYYPYSGVHYLKKREAPAEDQKADEAFLYNYYAHPYSSSYGAYAPYFYKK